MSRAADLIAPITKVVNAEDRRGDVITAAGLLALALALDALGLVRTSWSGLTGVPSWWFVVPAIVACTALVWRRFHPLGTLGVATVALVADIALGGSVGLLVIVWEALYARAPPRSACSAAGHRDRRRRRLPRRDDRGRRDHRARSRFAILAGLQAVTLLVMPMWWGANVRQGRELTAAAHERGAARA